MKEEERLRIEEDLKQPWEVLDDPGIDERTIVPDYYVDRPPTPEFIPNPSGVDKETQIGDLELFDFELEAEPILEVLVGKAIEQGRIEAIEEWERAELLKHKEEYADIREAELLEVQRLESIYNRSVEETRRRQLQQEARKQLQIHTQQKLLARLISRNALTGLSENSLQFLEAAGVLRAPREHDMQTLYIPHLLGLTEELIAEQGKQKPILEEGLSDMVQLIANEHREAIVNEYKRRLIKMEKDATELADKIARRKARAVKREKKEHEEWLNDLKVQIENQVIAKALQVEDSTTVKILELGIDDNGQSLYTIGGLLGELLITVDKIFEVLTEVEPDAEQEEQPEVPPVPIELTQKIIEDIIRNAIEPFLSSEATIDIPLLCNTEFEDIMNEEESKDVIEYDNLVTPGLKYLVRKMERYGFNPETITKIFSGIIRFKNKKLPEIQELQELLPEVPPTPEEKLNEMTEEEKAAEKERITKENETIATQNEEIKTKNEEIKAKNEEIQKENEFTAQLQNKIRIIISPQMLEHGKTCAIAWIGSIDEGDDSGAKRNPKAAQINLVKHLCVSNTVSDLKILILNKSKVTL